MEEGAGPMDTHADRDRNNGGWILMKERVMKKNGILAATLLLAALPGLAAPILLTTDDFQSYTVNELLPKTATATSGTYGYGAGVTEVFVRQDPADPNNKVASVHKDAATGGTYLDAFALAGTIKTFDQLTADGLSMVLRYDLYVSAENKNQFYVSLRTPGGTDNLATLYWKIPSGGSNEVRYLVAGGSEVAPGIHVTADTWHTVTMHIHPSGSDWALSATITPKATGIPVDVVSDAVVSLSSTEDVSLNRVRFYQFGAATGESFSLIDNVGISYIPEPGTAATLLLGMALFLARRLRRTRA